MGCALCNMDKSGECVFCRTKSMMINNARQYELDSRPSLIGLTGMTGMNRRYSNSEGRRDRWQDLREIVAYLEGAQDGLKAYSKSSDNYRNVDGARSDESGTQSYNLCFYSAQEPGEFAGSYSGGEE